MYNKLVGSILRTMLRIAVGLVMWAWVTAQLVNHYWSIT